MLLAGAATGVFFVIVTVATALSVAGTDAANEPNLLLCALLAGGATGAGFGLPGMSGTNP